LFDDAEIDGHAVSEDIEHSDEDELFASDADESDLLNEDTAELVTEASDVDLSDAQIYAPDLFVQLVNEAIELEKDHVIELQAQKYSDEQQEVLDLFSSELQEVCDELDVHLTYKQSFAKLGSHGDRVENLLEAAEIINYEGLTEEIIEIYQAIAICVNNPSEEKIDALIVWPYVLKHFVSKGLNPISICLFHVFNNKLREQSEHTELSDFLQNISRFSAPDIEAYSVVRATSASIEDLSLEIPEDTHEALLQSFLLELPDQSVEFTRAIEAFIEGKSFDDLDIARRIAHTIKGSGNTVGIMGLANMTHQLEDILDALAKQKLLPEDDLADLLLESADTLEVMTEAVLESRGLPDEALGVYQRILDWANVCDNGGVELNSDAINELSDFKAEAPELLSSLNEKNSGEVEQKEESSSKNINSVRVAEPLIDSLIRMAGENMISSGRIHEHTKSTKESLQGLRKQHAQLNSLMADLEQLVFIRGVSSDRTNSNSEFDPLEIEQYNELHTATQRLIENVVDCLAITENSLDEVHQLESVVIDQMQLQKQNQESVIQMRMLPVSQMSNRFNRAVRQACRSTGKKVDFKLLGENTLVDSNVLQQLVDPIMHILRNAIDHGIESPERRIQLGKPEKGVITLQFDRSGDQIIVSCSDDGAGLNHEKVLNRALANNLVPDTKTLLSAEEITRLILMPGFSTKDEVSQVSGRGIGMDIVNQRIKKIKGNLSIESQPGHGMTISVSLPVSLMSTHALLVDINDKRLAVSNHGVDDVVFLENNSIKEFNGKRVLEWRDELLITYTLSSLLHLPSFSDDKIAVIIRSSDGSYIAITVPFIVDSRDLVLKPLSKYLPKVDGIVGASILGDGRVTPVIDLTELDTHRVTDQDLINQASGLNADSSSQRIPCVLVVDDSLSARRSMSQFVSDLGYSVVTAKDGIEAQQMLEENLVISIITDLEMPRMNGIDLTRHLKTRNDYSNIPVMMVTSRSTDKHKELAQEAGVDHYFTKPFDEDRMAQVLNQTVTTTV